jgi:hypothetical protein
VSDHTASATKETRGDKHNVRYRGRCSCGRVSFMHYSTPEAARTAITRAHIAEVKEERCEA